MTSSLDRYAPKADRERRYARAFPSPLSRITTATPEPVRTAAVRDWCDAVGNPQPVDLGAGR